MQRVRVMVQGIAAFTRVRCAIARRAGFSWRGRCSTGARRWSVPFCRAAFGRGHARLCGETRSAAPGWRGQTPDSAAAHTRALTLDGYAVLTALLAPDAPANAPTDSSAPERRSGSTREDRAPPGVGHGPPTLTGLGSRRTPSAATAWVVYCVRTGAAGAGVPGGGGPEFGWPIGRPNESPPPEGMLADARPRSPTHCAPQAAAHQTPRRERMRQSD